MIDTRKPLFTLGRVTGTPGALAELETAQVTPSDLLDRHIHGDWGDLSEDDMAANEQALKDGSRILSAYRLATGQKVWVISEAADDHGRRPFTTLLLPNEY